MSGIDALFTQKQLTQHRFSITHRYPTILQSLHLQYRYTMKKYTIPILMLILALSLAACSSSETSGTTENPSDSATSSSTTTTYNLTASQLALGMLQLAESGQSLTIDQAKALLPLWQAYINLTQSDATAQMELEGLAKQIQGLLTPEQLATIQAMNIDDAAIEAYITENGISMRGAMGKGGAGAGTGPGAGGGPGGGLPGSGGGPGEVSPEVRATAIAKRLGDDPEALRSFQERALAAGVVTMLQEMTGSVPTPEPLTLGPRLVERLAEAAGVDAEALQASLDEGTSLTDAIGQQHGDLEAATTIIRDIYTNVYGLSDEELEQKVAEFMQ